MIGSTTLRLVAWREMRERAGSRAFRLSTLFLLVVTLGGSAIAPLGDMLVDSDTGKHLTIVEPSPPGLQYALAQAAERRRIRLTVSAVRDERVARQALVDGSTDAVLLRGDALFFRTGRDESIVAMVSEAATAVRLAAALQDLGLPAAQAEALIQSSSISVGELPRTGRLDGGRLAVSFAVVLLLFAIIMTYGQWVLLGTIQEKSSRVVEVILSAVTARQLLIGKVLGILSLGLAQMAVLALVSGTLAAIMGTIEVPRFTLVSLAVIGVWFPLGLLFYGFAFAAAGALVSRQEDAHNVTLPITLLLVGAYLLSLVVIVGNPDSTAATAISLFPVSAPIAMPARLAVGDVAVWEFVAAIALMLIASWTMINVAARLYTGGILGFGVQVRLADAWRGARGIGQHTGR